MKILVITFGGFSTGSTKFRIQQYESFLKDKGVQIEYVQKSAINEEFFEKLNEADILINQKCLLPCSLTRQIFQKQQRVLFDFDDAIYTRPLKPYGWITRLRVLKRIKLWLEKSSKVTVANGYLKKFAEQYSKCVHLIPMTLDLDIWKPFQQKLRDHIVLGWAGAPANLHHLERLESVWSHLLKENPNLKLAVYSGKKPKLSCEFEFFPFEDGKEHEFMKRIDVGLLPLTNEEFSRGKSPIKAIQYLACGIPVVGNQWGATKEILNSKNSIAVETEKEWLQGVRTLVKDRAMADEMSIKGRQWVELNFNKQTCQEALWKLLCSMK